MGLAIFSLIVLIVCIVVCVLAVTNTERCKFFMEIVCWISIVISVSIGVLSLIAFVLYMSSVSVNCIGKDLDLQEFKNQKSSIVRMLQEDYNSTNLSNAIDFNNKQKMIVVENNTFLFKYSTSYFSVDTIQIPETKFMPTSKLIVEGLESAPE